MKSTFLRIILLFAGFLLLLHSSHAQKKLLILGSSTSTCIFGPSSVDSCYVNRLQKYYQNNGLAIQIDNRAVGGDNCYHGMPVSNIPPPGRNSPRPYNNISDGLSANPDIVLINYPSNGYDVFSVDEVLTCLRTIKQTANNAGKPCYITTTQPRQDPEVYRTEPVRRKMVEIKDRVLAEFGSFAINFWDGIANPVDNSILDRYNADGTHLNNAGHGILFNRVLEKNIFNPSQPDNIPPTVPGNIRVVSTGSNYVNLAWDLSSDNTGVSRYHILVNNIQKYVTTLTNFTISDLFPNSLGYYSVSAEDFAGNISAPSPQVSATTSGSGAGKGLRYKYYEGDWNTLPNFNTLQPVKSGITPDLDLSPRGKEDNYAFLWEGYINILSPGNYTFELVSDDGSKLYFNSPYDPNSTPLINNDGLHAAQSVAASININAAGSFPIAVAFFEKTGGQQMELYWSGPGISRQPVPKDAYAIQSTSPGNGLSYKYYEGDWNTLPNFNVLQPVKSGSMPNLDLGPRNRDDYYAFLWEGQIKIQTPGTYTFELVSDDGSKLYFNSLYDPNAIPLVNNDGLHASQAVSGSININAAGSYPIAISFFEKNGGENMQVFWSGPGFARQLIPNEAFSGSPPMAASGLKFKYYEGDWNSLPDFNALQPLKSGSTSNIDLAPRTRNDYFAFLWEGNIKIQTPGTYTFELVSDDGSKLYFNKLYDPNATPLVNNDGLHASQAVTGSINISAAGSYPIAISFFEKNGGENMQVFWSGPGIARQLIPNEAFSGSTPTAESGLKYKYYEGDWNTLPNFNALQPLKSGSIPNIDLAPRTRNDYFAFLWEGYLKIQTPGTYTFELISDDGSKFYFNKLYDPQANALVSNDGLHASQAVSGSININAPGSYPVAISFFEKTGDENMQLFWSGPGIPRQLIPNTSFSPTSSLVNEVTYGAHTIQHSESMITTQPERFTGPGKAIAAYPNPFRSTFDISFYNTSALNNITTGLYDVSGKLLQSDSYKNIPAGSGTLKVLVKKHQEMAAGIYFLKLTVNGLPLRVIKLVKSKS